MYIHIYIHVFIYIYIYIHIYIYIYIYVYTYVYTCICLYIYLYMLHICIYTYICIYVCVWMCVYWVHRKHCYWRPASNSSQRLVLSTYFHTHTHIHTEMHTHTHTHRLKLARHRHFWLFPYCLGGETSLSCRRDSALLCGVLMVSQSSILKPLIQLERGLREWKIMAKMKKSTKMHT